MNTSIKKKLQVMVLIISATALIITSVLGVGIMMMIRSQSESALIAETKSSLTNLVMDKAALAQSQLEQYEEIAGFFAGQLSNIYAHPENYTVRKMGTVDEGDDAEFICTSIRRSKELDIRGNLDELGRTYNLADVLYPYIQDDSKNIAAFYWGDENGFLTLYDTRANTKKTFDEIYDFWDTSWYTACKKQRKTVITDVYMDAFGNGLTVTCAAPYYDSDGTFIGVFGVDILISDIYDGMVRLDLGEGDYSFCRGFCGDTACRCSHHQQSGCRYCRSDHCTGGGCCKDQRRKSGS